MEGVQQIQPKVLFVSIFFKPSLIQCYEALLSDPTQVFLPTVPGGGTVGLQMDFFILSFSSSSFTLPTFGCKDNLCGQCGRGGVTVDCGSCAEYTLLFYNLPHCSFSSLPPPIPPPSSYSLLSLHQVCCHSPSSGGDIRCVSTLGLYE